MLARLNPLRGENWPYLLGSVVAARMMVGLTRIAADSPALYPDPDASPKQRYDTFFERMFMEGLGTVGTFVVLHAAQDLTANLLQMLRPALHPRHLVETLKPTLAPAALDKVTSALAHTFGKSQLEQVRSVLGRSVFNQSNLHQFKTRLNDAALWAQIEQPASAYFARLNRVGKVPLLAGMGASIAFGGLVWQYLNDRVFRQRVVPALTRLVLKQPAAQPVQPNPHMLAAAQPLVLSSSLRGLSPTPPPAYTAGNPLTLQPLQSPPLAGITPAPMLFSPTVALPVQRLSYSTTPGLVVTGGLRR